MFGSIFWDWFHAYKATDRQKMLRRSMIITKYEMGSRSITPIKTDFTFLKATDSQRGWGRCLLSQSMMYVFVIYLKVEFAFGKQKKYYVSARIRTQILRIKVRGCFNPSPQELEFLYFNQYATETLWQNCIIFNNK